MKKLRFPNLLALCVGLGTPILLAQDDCPSPDEWPSTVDPNALVHYVDTALELAPPGNGWFEDTLTILSGGDQGTADVTIGGYAAKKVTGSYLNVADTWFEDWADTETIDILVQVYGDGALFDAQGQERGFSFLTGTLPEVSTVGGGSIPVEARNKKWNWVLFRIENGVRESDGTRFVGSIPANAAGNASSGGVNGGTIRFQSAPSVVGLQVRVIAFGEEGAFGEPEDFSSFCSSEACDPEPETNLASIDIDADTADRLVVLDNGDQTVTYEDNVGPSDDRRRAVRPNGDFLNFGITDEYLGLPCNDPRTVKLCVEFYDDPAFAGFGVRFGPEAFATDDVDGIGFFPADSRHTMEGTDTWIRRSWVVPAVNLRGVNAGAYTAGPRLISENDQVFVSSFKLAILRTGDHPLAGQDPLADCFQDGNICTEAYGNYAELDLDQDLRQGLDVGNDGGDQEMIIEEGGPSGDRRMAVRPAHDDADNPAHAHQFLNFALVEEPFGPSSQDNAHLAICVTYYDDPELVGAQFKPEVYQSDQNGTVTFAFTPDDFFVVLEGTDQWRTAYWEIEDMNFSGVNQGPQAAARFVVSDKVLFTSVRYAVIRPCGPQAGVNLLEECKPEESVALSIVLAGSEISVVWPAAAQGYTLQETPSLEPMTWSPVTTEPEVVDGNYVVTLSVEAGARYYRITK